MPDKTSTVGAQTRTETLKLRLTPDEKTKLSEMAAECDVEVSQYVREAVFGEPEPEPEDPEPAAPEVADLEYQLRPQSEEHLKQFPGDRKTDEQRVAFDAEVRTLVRSGIPEMNARTAAARKLFPRKPPVPYMATEKVVKAENPRLSPKEVTAEAKRRIAERAAA